MTHNKMMEYRTGKKFNYSKYQCIFDEQKGKVGKTHEHIVKEAHYLNAPGYIFDGIVIKTEVGWKYGCLKKF